MRSRFPPHLIFIAILVTVAVVAVFRLNRHSEALTRMETALAAMPEALRRLDEVQILISRLELRRQHWRREPGPRTQAAFSADLVELRDVLRDIAEHASLLADNVYFRQMQTITETLVRRLTGPPPAPTAEEIDRDTAQYDSLWNGLNAHVATEQLRLSRALRTLTRQLLAEAGGICLAFVVAAVLYLLSVTVLLDRPLRELGVTARTVTSGQLSARAERRGAGPVYDLAGDFNEMVAILVQSLYEEDQVIEELERKTRDLEAANRHKSHFLANVSHELKTPLNAIIGFADILSSGHHGELTPKQQDYLRRMFDAGQHLLGMISDLIDVAKLDLAALQLEPKDCDLVQELRQALDMVAPQMAAKGHTLTVTGDDTAVNIRMDPRRFRQIMLNLLSNAVKFTPDGGRVEVGVIRRCQTVAVAVTDSGVGIAAKHIDRIFDDFVQLDSKLHRQHEGTGIGLPLSRRLAELMDGQLTVTSKRGAGSTFTLSLPLPAVDGPAS